MGLFNQYYKNFLKDISNIPGWSTKRKIVVLEVDDWGAVRTRSKEARDRMIASGLNLEKSRFNYFDTLAGPDDLEPLFEILSRYKDFNGCPAMFTAVSVVANPDFRKIKESNFSKYYYEPLDVTLNSYFNKNTLELWNEGINSKVFYPEFHGREHLNPELWLRALQSGDKLLLNAFDNLSVGIKSNFLSVFKGGYLSAFDFENNKDFTKQEESIREGLSIFEKLFGYRARHFTSSGLIHHPRIEQTLREGGIKFVDVSKKHLEPQGNGIYKERYYKLGEVNKYNQVYITRNSRFEPNDTTQKDWVGSTLKDIEVAFRWKKPAVISSHRVNFVGGIEPENRTRGLKKLDELLKNIIKKWPDVEFMSVSQLGNLIMRPNNIYD